MFNGVIQSMQDGVVPGNFNLDNAADQLRKYDHVVYPNRAVHLASTMKAAMLKSFGFGQAGAEILLVSNVQMSFLDHHATMMICMHQF